MVYVLSLITKILDFPAKITLIMCVIILLLFVSTNQAGMEEDDVQFYNLFWIIETRSNGFMWKRPMDEKISGTEV